MKQSPDTKRLLEALDLLKRTKGISVYQISKKIGYAPQSFSRIRAGGQNVPLKWIHKICDTFGINKLWVFSNEQPILLAEGAAKGQAGKGGHVVNPVYSQKLPLYDSGFSKQMKQVLSEHIVDPNFFASFPYFEGCTLAYRISGDSMAPHYKGGDIVVCKKIKDKENIMNGETYVIITKDISTVRYIDPHPSDKNKILLRNDNPKFAPTPILRKDILGLYLVKGKVEVN